MKALSAHHKPLPIQMAFVRRHQPDKMNKYGACAALCVGWLLLTVAPVLCQQNRLPLQEILGQWSHSDGKGITFSYEFSPDGSYSSLSTVDMPRVQYKSTIQEGGRYLVERSTIILQPSMRTKTIIDGPKTTTKKLPIVATTILWQAARDERNQTCLQLKNAPADEGLLYCRPSQAAGSRTPSPGTRRFGDAALGGYQVALYASPVLAWLSSVLMLYRYRRAVGKSARRQSGFSQSSIPQAPQSEVAERQYDLRLLRGRARLYANLLYSDLLTAPWRSAASYVIGGLGYSVVMATATVILGGRVRSGAPVWPLAAVWALWLCLYAWPVVLASNIVAASTRMTKLRVVLGYFIMLAAIGSFALVLNHRLTAQQIMLSWGLSNLPPTFLILLFLNRGVRAVGPLMLALFLVTLGLSSVALELALEYPPYARALTNLTWLWQSPFPPVLIATTMLLPVLVPVWWILVQWIRHKYDHKRISDESITLDAVWLVFTATCYGFVSAERFWWMLASAIAFVIYKIGTVGARRFLMPNLAEHSVPTTLLLLRSFAVGKDSERLFDALEKHWRRVGSMHLIAGADLAKRTIEPQEFLDFLTRRLARRFITDPESLALRLSEMDTAPDRDGRFRVNDFFCHEDTWQTVVSRLVAQSDVVLMDLRGFSLQNAGCIFEIRELARLVPLGRVVFLIDHRTNGALLQQCVTEGGCSGRPQMLRLRGMRGAELRRLLAMLALAAVDRGRLTNRPPRSRAATRRVKLFAMAAAICKAP